jgi:hypothetical protein
MCHLNYLFDGYAQTDQLPRPFPRLAWAIPVNITTLGANLEAYSNIDPQVRVLRLAHRFGSGPLSKMPQEIIEMIIDEAQQLERRRTRPVWNSEFLCFQGKCGPRYHYMSDEYDIAEESYEQFMNTLDLYDYTYEQTAEMLEGIPEEEHSEPDWDEDRLYEAHIDAKADWLTSVCLCKLGSEFSSPARKLSKLNDVSLLGFKICTN